MAVLVNSNDPAKDGAPYTMQSNEITIQTQIGGDATSVNAYLLARLPNPPTGNAVNDNYSEIARITGSDMFIVNLPSGTEIKASIVSNPNNVYVRAWGVE